MSGCDEICWAREVASSLLPPLGDRWRHVTSVAHLAGALAPALGCGEAGILVAAAFVHDVGYAPQIAVTGFHPLDGGRFLRAQGQEELARLVAHHSGARREAMLRGLADYEKEFPFGGTILDRALAYCDLTTGPTGRRVTLDERIAEISIRYGAGHVVARAINWGRAEFQAIFREMETRATAAGVNLNELPASGH